LNGDWGAIVSNIKILYMIFRHRYKEPETKLIFMQIIIFCNVMFVLKRPTACVYYYY